MMKRLFPCLSFQPRCVFAAVSSLSLLTPAWGAGLTGSETDPIGLATDSVTLEGGAAPGVWIQSGSHTIDALSDSGTLSVSGSPGSRSRGRFAPDGEFGRKSLPLGNFCRVVG